MADHSIKSFKDLLHYTGIGVFEYFTSDLFTENAAANNFLRVLAPKRLRSSCKILHFHNLVLGVPTLQMPYRHSLKLQIQSLTWQRYTIVMGKIRACPICPQCGSKRFIRLADKTVTVKCRSCGRVIQI